MKTLNIVLNYQEDDDLLPITARFLCTISGIQGLCLETFAFHTNKASLQLLQNLASLLQEQKAIRVLDMPMEIGHERALHNSVQDLIYHALPKELKEFTTDLIFFSFDDYLTRAGTIVRQAQQLHSLKLYLDGSSGWWPEGFYDLTPFLELSELENLELVTFSGIHLDPDDIVALGKSFPKMVRFAIKPLPCPVAFDVGIKATALIDFATTFPKLEVLGIRIEPIHGPLVLPWRRSTDHHSHSQAQAYPSFNSSRFRLLDVGPSFLSDQDVPDMAELLSVLCHHPLLEIKYERQEEPEYLEPEETPEEDSTKTWRKVEALVKLVHGTERDTTKPYHEWCQALILNNMDVEIDEDEERIIAEGELA
ncbi:hypothetical protein FRC04_002416 [Tulasnella sp. 424]|nr:hypothetical protein FRC04_002416 [Tulasnella sp. 424]